MPSHRAPRPSWYVAAAAVALSLSAAGSLRAQRSASRAMDSTALAADAAARVRHDILLGADADTSAFITAARRSRLVDAVPVLRAMSMSSEDRFAALPAAVAELDSVRQSMPVARLIEELSLTRAALCRGAPGRKFSTCNSIQWWLDQAIKRVADDDPTAAREALDEFITSVDYGMRARLFTRTERLLLAGNAATIVARL